MSKILVEVILMAVKVKRSAKLGMDKYKYEVAQEIGRFSAPLSITPKNLQENNFKKIK